MNIYLFIDEFKHYYKSFLSIKKKILGVTILDTVLRYWLQAKLFSWYRSTFNIINFGKSSSFFRTNIIDVLFRWNNVIPKKAKQSKKKKKKKKKKKEKPKKCFRITVILQTNTDKIMLLSMALHQY